MAKHRGTSKFTRDVVVCSAATFSLVYEIVVGGGRPAVLTACVSLLLSPLIMRVDEARKGNHGNKTDDEREDKADAESA